MTKLHARRYALGMALALAGVAHGQEGGAAPADLRGRTGPSAGSQALPAYAAPNSILPPAVPSGGETPLSGAAATIDLSDLHIDGDLPARRVRARSGWRPAAGALVRLDVQRREPLNAAWVRRQFQANHLIGQATAADRVVALVLLINQAYAQNGFVDTGLLFERRDWSAHGSVLKLKLVVGRVVPMVAGGASVPVTWTKGDSGGLRRSYVLDRLPSARAAPLNVIDLEHDFRLLADDPAIRTVNAQLLPGVSAGEANLALTVDPQPRLDLYITAANSRSPTIGGERIAVGGSLRNAAFSGDLLSAEGGLTRGLEDGVVGYSTPFLDPRTIFTVRAAHDQAAVIEPALRSLNIRSEETDIEGGLSRILFQDPLTPTADGSGWRPARSLVVGLQAAEKYSTSSLLGEPFSFSPGEVDGHSYFTVLRATADFVQRGERQVIALSGTASFGLRGSGSDAQGVVRPDPDFHVLLGQFNYARRLTSGGLEFHARLVGQWSDGPLYTAEQLSAGGQTTVRGYRENLLLADSGGVGSLELACPVTLGAGVCTTRGEGWKTVRITVFVDGAYMRNHTNPQPAPDGLASLGVSLAWNPSPGAFVRLTYGGALISPMLSGPRNLQDDGFSFEVTLHPLAFLR